jgi:hypothetical protein
MRPVYSLTVSEKKASCDLLDLLNNTKQKICKNKKVSRLKYVLIKRKIFSTVFVFRKYGIG